MGFEEQAPGRPGIPPRWTSSAKSGVGTSLQPTSRVWFTLSHGILNEVYYPRLDQACVRDLGFIVTDGAAFFSEEKRDTTSSIEWLAPGVPAFRVTSTCKAGRYRIVKEVLTDPRRDVVLIEGRLEPLIGSIDDYRVFVLVAPHLANAGAGNTAWVGDYKGIPMLFGTRAGIALAAGCAPQWTGASAGFVGRSDGWTELVEHGCLVARHARAADGNVALTGEVPLVGGRPFVVALGFGTTPAEAGYRVRASLIDGFSRARERYVREWTGWQQSLSLWPDTDAAVDARVSAAVIRSHEEKRIPGAIAASLSIPWGDTKGDNDLGGYHLVWPRDLVESAGALLALGAHRDARRVMDYLRATQNADGSWPQNMWVDGEPFWHGVQLDETAFPILLVDMAWREGLEDDQALQGFWPMVRRAAGFIVQRGPATDEDRWEEDGGVSPFTAAVEIAALLVAAALAERSQAFVTARYLRETADSWNAYLDEATFARNTRLARRLGVEGYYVRIAPPDVADGASPVGGFVPIKNRPWPQPGIAASEIVSPDALALVRFGLRAPDDPRILGTVRVIDALLKVELPQGPVWRRYNEDGYGEHEDGSAFDGTGRGRPWPLLAGERAHYELAAGRVETARRLLRTLTACAGAGGLLPEQVWDDADVPQRELVRGRPSGSAMPLVWAHAEHVKLERSLRDGRVFDLPRHAWQRYVVEGRRSDLSTWRFSRPRASIWSGRRLRIETLAPCVLHWSVDGWRTTRDSPSVDTGLGIHVVDVPTSSLETGTTARFTFYWPEAGRWEQRDFQVAVVSASDG